MAQLARLLAPWGRFKRPVRVRTTDDEADLRASAACPTRLSLHAVAGIDEVVLLAPDRWRNRPHEGELALVLVHELAHVLLFQRCAAAGRTTAPYLPTWFREGMAVVAAEGRPHASLRRWLGERPDLERLPGAVDAVMAADPDACYAAGAVAFQDWFDQFGGRGLASVCRAMRAGKAFAGAFEHACKVTEPAWLTEWVKGLRVEAARW
jgi:hypothetical protein